MASAPAAESILFIAALAAAAVVAGSLATLATQVASGVENRAASLHDDLTGRISIVNDPLNVPTSPLTLYVLNTGSSNHYLGGFTFLIDGQASTAWTVTVGGAAAERLQPGELAKVEITDITPAAGDHLATVITDHGHRASLEFTV
jgi:archaellum component FlaG (FlaF/FlaG flagellin family)